MLSRLHETKFKCCVYQAFADNKVISGFLKYHRSINSGCFYQIFVLSGGNNSRNGLVFVDIFNFHVANVAILKKLGKRFEIGKNASKDWNSEEKY